MSLINKMLQDLDARGTQGGAALQPDIKPVRKAVLQGERAVPTPVVLAGMLGAVVMAVAGVFGWRWWHQAAAPVRPLAPAVTVAPAAPVPVIAPAPAPVPAEAAAPVTAAAVLPAPAPAPAPASAPARPAARKPRLAASAPIPAAHVARPVAEAAAPKRAPAEAHYRSALAKLQEGRVVEAMAQLHDALGREPQHEAARQTLVGLLIEGGRSDEAMRQLQAGLALDARQPSLAMLLARLQIAGGGSGVAVLERSLPAANGNAAYHAFLAGALQRDQRHREAVDQYVAALRQAPGNGVWLMGLGISLQADKRPLDALEAFQRARESGELSAPLQSFVERKIVQLQP